MLLLWQLSAQRFQSNFQIKSSPLTSASPQANMNEQTLKKKKKSFTFSLKSTVHRIIPQRDSIRNSPASLIYIRDGYSLETSVLVSAPLSELIMGMRMDN